MMLRRIRIAFALLFFVAVTLLFLDFTGTAHMWLGWAAKVQFLPSVLAMNAAVIAGLVVTTLLFGRIYCSVICPLGVLQDVFSYLAGKRKRNRLSYAPGMTKTRIVFLVLFALLAALGLLSTGALIAPYSAYGRIASNVFAPLWSLGNNILAVVSERFDSYAFYSTEVWFKGFGVFFTALATLSIVGILGWKSGRTYCNTVCPVGTVLGFLSRYSLLKPVIDISKCSSCGLCSRNCKSQCINFKEHTIDYSRCVSCFDCIGKCRKSAISYTFRRTVKSETARSKKITSTGSVKHKPVPMKIAGDANLASQSFSNSRRGFFSFLLFFAGSAVAGAQEMKVDGGLAPIKERRKPTRTFKILPPGAMSAANLADRCTACQLCVSACPSHILVPSSSLSTFMQPEISYERGHCRIECVKCSQVCPAGAILPIDPVQKASTQIGRAVWTSSRCMVNTDHMQCDNCFRQCPTGAIQMVAQDPHDPESLKIPTVDEARCIGCGACENLCPARPIAAICVDGNPVHHTI